MAQRPTRRALNPSSTVNPHAAGIDIEAPHHVVAVAAERDPIPVRTFQTFSGDLHALADWLHAVGITTFGDAKMALVDYIEVFYSQRSRHSTLGQIRSAAFERRHAQAA